MKNSLRARARRRNEFEECYTRGARARITAAGTVVWYLLDYQNSVIGMVDSTGSSLGSISYDGFGNMLTNTTGVNGDRFGFTSREWDSSVSLQYNWARFYDPNLGKWTSADPMGFEAGDANLYRYAANGPTNGVDPSGLEVKIVGKPKIVKSGSLNAHDKEADSGNPYTEAATKTIFPNWNADKRMKELKLKADSDALGDVVNYERSTHGRFDGLLFVYQWDFTVTDENEDLKNLALTGEEIDNAGKKQTVNRKPNEGAFRVFKVKQNPQPPNAGNPGNSDNIATLDKPGDDKKPILYRAIYMDEPGEGYDSFAINAHVSKWSAKLSIKGLANSDIEGNVTLKITHPPDKPASGSFTGP